MNLTAVLVEDQPLARSRLRDLLARIGGVELLAEATTASEGLDTIRALDPDVILVDIQMPGPSGLDMLAALDTTPYVILTTAHSEFAVEAFELAADDYILKPFGVERLSRAIDRARQRIERDRVAGALTPPTAHEPVHSDRIFVPGRGRIVPVKIDRVCHIEADGDYVKIWTGHASYLVRQTLGAMVEQLDPARFMRIHRSHIVGIDHVVGVKRYDGARFLFELSNGAEVLSARSRNRAIRSRLGL